MSDDDILVGMKEIAGFLRVGQHRVRQLIGRHADIPIRKEGQYISHKQELRDWVREFVARKKEE